MRRNGSGTRLAVQVRLDREGLRIGDFVRRGQAWTEGRKRVKALALDPLVAAATPCATLRLRSIAEMIESTSFARASHNLGVHRTAL